VGYCGEESVGGQLLQGVKEIELMGDPCNVVAEIGALKSMSAHGDMDDLCQFLSCQEADKVKTVYLVHGEYEVQKKFVNRLERKGFSNIQIPALHEIVEI
jgi:metallo-beta-lactamase family protein